MHPSVVQSSRLGLWRLRYDVNSGSVTWKSSLSVMSLMLLQVTLCGWEVGSGTAVPTTTSSVKIQNFMFSNVSMRPSSKMRTVVRFSGYARY